MRSDIYALGLVIYELVTGRRAFEGKGLAELARRSTATSGRSTRRCSCPASPPPSSARSWRASKRSRASAPPRRSSVAAMLGGRDPLGAAIAAGETPSPELVAAAGETEGLGPRAAWACLAAVVAGVLVFPVVQAPRHLLSRVPIEKSPAALEDRARELLSRLSPAKPDGRRDGPSPRRRLHAVGEEHVTTGRRAGTRSPPVTRRFPGSGTGRARGRSRRRASPGACHGTTPRSSSPGWPAPATTSAGACSRSTPSRLSSSHEPSPARRAARNPAPPARPTGPCCSPRPDSIPRPSSAPSRCGRRRSTSTREWPGRAAGRRVPSSRCVSRPRATAAGRSGSSSRTSGRGRSASRRSRSRRVSDGCSPSTS